MNKFPIVAFLSLTLCLCGRVGAYQVPEAKPLTESIAQAKVVVLARLVAYVPNNKYKNFPTHPLNLQPLALKAEKNARISHIAMDAATAEEVTERNGSSHSIDVSYSHVAMDVIPLVDVLKWPGHYTLQAAQTLKGQCEPTLQMDIPLVQARYYGGMRRWVEEGDTMLLLLTSNPQEQWTPVDPLVPFITLATKGQQPNIPDSQDVKTIQARVVNLLLSSLSNPALRQENTYLLRSFVDPQIVVGLAPYIDDPNIRTQDNVLFCMAVNHQIAVIPRIAQLSSKMWLTGDAPDSLRTLQDFHTAEAIPYLNPLLFELPLYTRLNTMFAFSKLDNRTSIPYLLLALKDPDLSVAQDAYGIMHRLLPTLKPGQGYDYFQAHREPETSLLLSWWQDELAGKHPVDEGEAEPDPAVSLRPLQKFEAADLPQLNQGLFMLSETTRRAAARGLEQFADASSIPYLLIALYDPQPDISFSAYTSLRRLLPELGATSRAQWNASHQAQTKAAFDWWQKHLLEAEKKQLAF